MTVVVGIAAQPQDFVILDVVVHPGTKQVWHAVPVEVTVGQETAELQGFVEVIVVGRTTVDIWTTVVDRTTVDT